MFHCRHEELRPAPTFLLRAGDEQVRSVVAALAGDPDAASHVELVLPETGVCSLANRQPAATTEPATAAAGCCA